MRRKYLKRLLSAALIAGVIATSVPITTGNVYANYNPYDYYDQGYEEYIIGDLKLFYKIYDEEVSLEGYEGDDDTVIIPEEIDGKKVTAIGEYAFSDFSANNVATNVTIPKSVTTIKEGAFKTCSSITNINVDEDNMNYMSKDGVLYNKNMTSLIWYPSNKSDMSYTIPETVTTIGCQAFYKCKKLKNIIIPKSVTMIGESAFEGCTGLTNIEIPDSVTEIDYSTFEDCTALKNIKIPNSVTSIKWGAFGGCTGLTNINVDENNAYYVSKDGVLFNKEMTSLIWYPAGKSEISYVVPKSVKTIKHWAFEDCIRLTDIIFPESLTDIDFDAFKGCTGLTNITLPESITRIGSAAFEGCTALTDITLPKSITEIERSVFEDCTGLTNITLPESITRIESEAFKGCTGLTNIEIPDSVTYIGLLVFEGCSGLTNISVDEDNAAYMSKDGILFNKEMTSLICYPAKKTDSNYTIPETVTTICRSAFSNCKELNNVVIPESVTEIEWSAFQGCTGLTGVEIPNSVTNIGDGAFLGCTSLTDITLPEHIIYIGEYAFSECVGLTSVTILGTNVSIGYGAFLDIPNVTIYGYKNSGVESYANKYNINFRIIGETVAGDINGDGTINSTDAVAIQKYLAGNVIEGFTKESADLNGDGEVNSADSVLLMKYLAGYEVKFSQ